MTTSPQYPPVPAHRRSAENIMKRIIRIIAAILISLSFAHAEWIGEFPGLDKLIKEADAIVILRIDHSDGDFGGIELYSTHDCFIYQSLKGDIPTKKRIRLKLMDARQHSPNLFAYQSTLLVFLTKKRAPSEPTDYRALETKGSAILLPPTGLEATPVGEQCPTRFDRSYNARLNTTRRSVRRRSHSCKG